MSQDIDHNPPTTDPAKQTEPLTERQLRAQLNALMLEVAEMVDATFPPSTEIGSTEHVQNYDAMKGAIGVIGDVLSVLPAEQEFRQKVLSYVEKAWLLTLGAPVHDDVVGRCIRRALDDYTPEIPPQRRRGQMTDEPGDDEPKTHTKTKGKK